MLPYGIKWEQMSLSHEDSQWLESRQFSVNDIARFYGVQPHLIAEMSGATFSNIEQQSLEFLNYSIGPWLINIQKAIDRALLTAEEQGVYFSEFMIESLLRADIVTRTTAFASMLQNGYASRNEIRQKLNMNKQPDLDDYTVQVNLVPAGLLGQNMVPVTQSASSPEVKMIENNTDKRTEEEKLTEKRVRSAKGRNDLKKSFQPLIRSTMQQIYKRERVDIVRKISKISDDDNGEFKLWLSDFYDKHVDFSAKKLEQVYLTYSRSIADAANTEIDNPKEIDVTELSKTYALANAKKQAGVNLDRINKKIDKADTEDDLELLIENEFDYMEEDRSTVVANDEVTYLASAVAKVAWGAAGVTIMVWQNSPDACNICKKLNGKVTSITGAFADKSDVISGDEDQSNLIADRTFTQPPLHDGCDCFVTPQ
jgi:hypothetical protein